VLGLLAEHLPETNVSARVAWLYEKNPHGRALTVLAYDERTNEPLGVASVFPRKLTTNGRVFLGAIGGDAYVRPSARRRGVATAMHKALHARQTAEGVELMFGPPEPPKIPPHPRAGSRIITHVRRYVRPAWLHAFAGPLSRMGRLRRVRLESIAEGDRRLDAIFERALDPAHVTAVRDAAYFKWKYLENPASIQRPFVVTHEHRPIGICVLERKDKRVAIIDLVASAKDYARTLLAAMSAHEASSFVFQLNDRGPFAEELHWAGLLPRERKPFQVLATTSREPNIFDASRWYYTWGDGDMDQLL